MDPLRNPYAPGAGVRPPQLAGRDADLEAFEITLQRIQRRLPERSLVIAGRRGVGKTVLLLEFQSLAERLEWATAKLEARPGMEFRPVVTRAVHQLLRNLSRRHRANDRIKRVFRTLKSFAVTASPSGELSVRLDVDPEPGRADSGDDETDVTELLIDVAEAAASAQTGAALFIDEMQDLSPAELAAIVGAFHEISQHQLPLLVAGAGLPHLPTLLSAAKTYAERLFQYRRIERLTEAEASEALVLPAKRLGVEFTDEAVAAILELSGGYPYFLQEHGKHAWEAAVDSPIDLADVELATAAARDDLDVGFFGPRYERATPRERHYLHAMASLGRGPKRTAAVADALGRSLTNVSSIRDGLIKKGLVYAVDRGFVDFTVPLFDEFLLSRE